MSAHPIKVTLDIDVRKFLATMRALTRSAQQAGRFRTSRPVSRERLDIAKLGLQQMTEAIAWFNDNLKDPS